MSEKMRSEFEGWVSNSHGFKPSIEDDGTYCCFENDWIAWQAAYLAGRASMKEEAAKLEAK